jgi:hypothetical protein
MRLYIKTIIKGEKRRTYEWVSAIEDAWHWDTQEQADADGTWIEQEGIFVRSTITGESGFCTDFRVESRPQGGFAISCEHPLH